MIRLKKANDKAFFYHGAMNYIIAYNFAAGKKNVYDVFVLSSDDPVVIGRELDLKLIRELISDYESFAKNDYHGDRTQIQNYITEVNRLRKLMS